MPRKRYPAKDRAIAKDRIVQAKYLVAGASVMLAGDPKVQELSRDALAALNNLLYRAPVFAGLGE